MTKRYFTNDAPLSRVDAHSNLIASLTCILEQQPPDEVHPGGWAHSGLYYGPSSIAYLFFRLSEIYPSLRIKGHHLATWSQRYLNINLSHYHHLPAATPSHCGIGIEKLVVSALDASIRKTNHAVDRFCDQLPSILANGQHSSNEWLYGRAGFLYLTRMIKAHTTEDEGIQRRLQDALDRVVDRILQTPKPWMWHGSEYHGAVHGTIGIIAQCVLSCPDRAVSVLEPDLLEMLDLQYDGGNWPSSARSHDDRLVQFCHGAPGFVLSLLKLRPHYPHLADRIDRAIARGRQCIWERGLLTKEPCICHGISGNALALDSPYFEHFLGFTTLPQIQRGLDTGLFDESDAPYSLMCGEAGRAWTWAVMDKGLEKSVIGFSDL